MHSQSNPKKIFHKTWLADEKYQMSKTGPNNFGGKKREREMGLTLPDIKT